MFQSSNPVLDESKFAQFDDAAPPSQTMTVGGAVSKTAILLGLCLATAGFGWGAAINSPSLTYPLLIGGLITGLVLAIATIFKPHWSPVTAPLYALAEGVFLGVLSALFAMMYDPNLVFSAVVLTFGTLATMLLTYKLGLIKVTEKFRAGVIAATGAIAFLYMAVILMHLLGLGGGMSLLHNSSWWSIGLSGFVIVIAALNLVLDFDLIEKGAQHRAPRYMEWFAAFGLMVTLIWLYIEFLRLLAKLRD